jgi:hypothetical protein
MFRISADDDATAIYGNRDRSHVFMLFDPVGLLRGPGLVLSIPVRRG